MPQRFEVAVVLDESGSMAANVTGALDGVNGFFRTLREQPAHMRVSLAKFSKAMQYIYQRIFLAELRDVTKEDYRPEGGTLLYDSILRTVADLEAVVQREESNAVVVIVTDGYDTDSTATAEQVEAMVKAKLATGRWTFLYFGPDGSSQTHGMGIPKANRFLLVPGSNEGMKAAFETAAEETVKLLTAGSGPITL